MGPDVVLVNSADETALVVQEALLKTNMARSLSSSSMGGHEFYSSGDVQHFAELGRRFLGPELSAAKYWQTKSN
jgi:glutamate racemase